MPFYTPYLLGLLVSSLLLGCNAQNNTNEETAVQSNVKHESKETPSIEEDVVKKESSHVDISDEVVPSLEEDTTKDEPATTAEHSEAVNVNVPENIATTTQTDISPEMDTNKETEEHNEDPCRVYNPITGGCEE